MTIARRVAAIFTTFIMLSLIACSPAVKRESPGQYVDDSVITARVKSALVADPELKATEINVETYKGVVQLSGFVASPEHIPKATELVRKLEGVKDVKNAIAVKR